LISSGPCHQRYNISSQQKSIFLSFILSGTSSQRSIEESTEDSEFTLNLNLQQVKQDPVSTDAKPESADKDKTSAEDKAPPTAEATEVIIEKVFQLLLFVFIVCNFVLFVFVFPCNISKRIFV
jgi:hypothetical protein